MGLMKKLTSAVVASSLVLGAVSTAFAAPAADEVNNAFARLNHYNVVQGVAMPDGTVSPALEQNITRAQLITIVTRAFGQEENAKLLTGAKTGYSDVDGNAGVEWATGYIFMGQRIAAQKGITIGRPGNLFAPSENVSQIETLAFIMKFLGIEVGTGDTWVEETLANAKAAGLLTDAEAEKFIDNANAPANRGHVFAMLDSIFASYNKLEGGKTVYTAYVDATAPELSVNAPELTTDKASITLTGSVKGDFSGLFLGSENVTPNADGTFSVEVALNVGANDITLTAVDLAGNTDDYTVTVTRSAGVAAKITASLADSLTAGSTTDLAFEVTDANGVKIDVPASELQVTVGGNVGTYADGKFTAAEKVGTGTVTVAYGDLTPATIEVSVVAGELAQVIADKTSVAKGETITLTAADKFGNAIASGVTFSAEGNGIAVTGNGTVYTAAEGKYTVTAKVGEATASTTIGVYGAVTALQVSAPETVTANGITKKTVTVSALDEFGNKVVGFDEKNIKLSGVGVTTYNADEVGTDTAVTEDGVATFLVTVDAGLAGEDVVLTATYSEEGKEDITGETTFAAAAPVATALKVASNAPKFLAANKAGEATVAVTVVDQEGETFEGAYDVTATITGPGELAEDTAVANGSDAAKFVISNYKTVGVTGAITLTATVEGIGSVSHTVNSVIAGAPAKIALSVEDDETTKKATESFTFTAQIQDANGVPVVLSEETSGSKKLTIELPEEDELENVENVDAPADVDLNNNSFETTFELSIKDGKPFTGSLPVKVSYTVIDPITEKETTIEGSMSVSFVPGDVAGLSVDREIVEAPVAAPTATYTFYVSDLNGNAVPKADVELDVFGFEVEGEVYTASDLVTINGAKGDTKVKTNAEGKATVTVAARPYANRTWAVKATTDTLDSGYGVLSVEESVVASIDTALYKEVDGKFIKATSVKAGEEFYVVATVKDNYGGLLGGKTLTGVADDVLGLVEDDEYTTTDELEFVEFDDNSAEAIAEALSLEEGQYVAKALGGKAGIVTVGAKYTGTQNEIAKTSNISVKANSFADLSIADKAEEIEVTGGTVSEGFSIKLSDLFGNAVTTTTAQKIEWNIEAVTDKGGQLVLRNSPTGNTINSLSTRSATTFYVDATTSGEEYTITFTSGDSVSETIKVVVK